MEEIEFAQIEGLANSNGNNQMANSDAFSVLAATLVKEKIQQMQKEDHKETPILNQFAGEVGISGLSDSIKSKHTIVKLLWLLIFFGGLSATGYFVYLVFREYRQEPTAMKITFMKSDVYPYPPIALCVDTWLNVEKAMEMGLSEEGIQFVLRYLISFEDVANQYLKRSKQAHGIRKEILTIFHKYNMTSVADLVKSIALDAVLGSKKEKEIGFRCSKCPPVDRLEKTIINEAVCYLLPLDPVEGKLRQTYGLPEFELRVPDLSGGFQDRDLYWKMYVNPLQHHFLADNPYTSVFAGHSQSIRILTEELRSTVTDPKACVHGTDDPKHTNYGYSSMSCVLDCASDYYRVWHGCSVLNLDRNRLRHPNEYCNSYYWDRWPVHPDYDSGTARKSIDSCMAKCTRECMYHVFVVELDHHISHSLELEAAAWKNETRTEIYTRWIKMYFIHIDALSGGIKTFIEVSTYSFQTLISNIGGTCGIWIGVSVMTLIHLGMFFLERLLGEKHGEDKNADENGNER